MALAADRCVCLRRVEFSETSQVLTLFTRGHGLIKVLAKGAHRRTKAGASKFDGGIDLLDLGDAVFITDAGRDLGTLTEWKLLEGNLPLRERLRPLYLAEYVAELLSLLVEAQDPHPDLFDRVEHVLGELASPRAEEAFLSFQLDLLRDSGYLPELFVCVNCGRPTRDREAVYFSAARGGIVCRDCEAATPDRLEVDGRLLRLVQGVIRLPRVGLTPRRLPRLSRLQTDPLNRLLSDHITHTLGRRLRLWRYVIPPATPAAKARPATAAVATSSI